MQDNIYDSDVSTMILFNRMMVTLGMCAFRLGKIYDAHQCLYDICSGRVRELLAQGVNTSRFSEKSAEQEKAEKRRLVPYHQHINLDLLEACHLISAMLLEVPNMAGNPVDGDGGQRRQRVISRTFRKFHDQHNHQVFTGPPEDTRSYIMQASKALMKGDWHLSVQLLKQMEVWDLVPGENAASKISDMLTAKIKLEGLRTYLFAFSAQYDSLSLAQLCGMFEMTKNEVHCVVSKMMINRELYASWDQPTETIVLRKIEPSPLQVMALQFAEKAAALVEANERLLDSQSGSYGYKDDHHGGYWKSGGEGGGRWQDRRGGNSGAGGGGNRGNNSGGGPSGGDRYGGRRPGRGGGRSSGGRSGRGNTSGGRGRDGGGRGRQGGGRGNNRGPNRY
jgi:translation initiation factor 3 subunit C